MRFFIIQKGKVKVTTLSKQGKEAVVAILGEGNFFGEGCLAGQPLRISTQTAITDCSLSRLDKATVVRLLHDQPDFASMFMKYLLARNIRMEADLIDQLVQLKRETARAPPSAAREFRPGRQAAADIGGYQSGNACRHDRRDTIPCQFLSE